MKLFVILALISVSATASINSLKYNILPGLYHKGGSIEARVTEVDPAREVMEVTMDYDVIKKPFVPAPAGVLNNSMSMELPIEFQDERGYLELARRGTIEIEKATLTYLGRVNFGKYENAHLIRIVGKNGKFECEVTYHPQVPELGWPHVELTLHVSILKNYKIVAELK